MLGQHSRHGATAVIEARIAQQPVQAFDRARLGIDGAVNDERDSGLHHGAGTHRAGLERDIQRAVFQPPAS